MRRSRINLLRLKEELSEVKLRLATVTVAYLSWHEFIKRYDRPRTLFYLNPPYYKAPFYEHNLELEGYIKMASILAKIKARFILSINDHPEMRKAFHLFNIDPVILKYTVGKELLITNF